jgi:beta-glucosidase
LPITFPRELSDTSAAAFPHGRDNAAEFGEGVFLGYRHFDKEGIAPLFPFGHGLSYTTFEYGAVTVPAKVETGRKIPVSVTLKNSGTRAGAEVVQLYLNESKPRLPRAPQELKAFQRVELKPGETRAVTFELAERAFSFFDPDRHIWTTIPGEFEIRAGSSSRDIRARAKFELVVPPPPSKEPPIGSLKPNAPKTADGKSNSSAPAKK